MSIATRQRIQAAFGILPGVIVGNPIIEASERWGPEGSSEDLRRWLRDPVTVEITKIIQALAMNPPACAVSGAPSGYGVTGVDAREDYGVTTGLQLAAQVLTDPTVLFPHQFDSPSEGTAPLSTDYLTPAFSGKQ